MLFFDKNTYIFCNFANGFLYFFWHTWILFMVHCIGGFLQVAYPEVQSTLFVFALLIVLALIMWIVLLHLKLVVHACQTQSRPGRAKMCIFFCCSIDSVAFNMHKSVVHSVWASHVKIKEPYTNQNQTTYQKAKTTHIYTYLARTNQVMWK